MKTINAIVFEKSEERSGFVAHISIHDIHRGIRMINTVRSEQEAVDMILSHLTMDDTAPPAGASTPTSSACPEQGRGEDKAEARKAS